MIDRRTFLGGATAATVLGVVGAGVASAEVPPPAGPFPPLAPLPPGAPVRRLFTPAEQRFAPYLAILPGMVNDVITTDPATVGFFGGGWWRTPSEPYNARVQEHVYTLSWFYANRRPWNPYYLDPALRNRLEAAIVHYLNLQHADGSFPEYSITEKSKAATGFGLGYLAKTLANLRQVNALPVRRAELEAALHQGVTWFLDPANPIWAHPIEFANQNTSGLSSSQLALKLNPDAGLSKKLHDRIEFLAANGQSAAGFFYEPTGMDINYNFEVMLPELAEIYALTGNRAVVGMARKFADWFGHNVVREPDGSGSLTYVATSSRTHVSYYDDVIPDPDRTNLGSLFVPEVPDLAAFFTTREENLDATYFIGDRAWDGSRKVPGSAPVVVRYGLDTRVRTDLTITRDTVTRAVRGTTPLTEQVPLVLHPGDDVRFADGTPVTHGADASATASGLTIRRGPTTITIGWGTALSATVTATTVKFLRDGARRLHVLRVPHPGTLTTEIRLR
jgi:hypothetical protein